MTNDATGPDAPTRPFPPPAYTGLGLVRPAQGRYVAGVCAAVGRATNTDPILWRVLAVVLTLFGGVGLLLYLIGWLLIPAEGDTASAMEALVGRGNSNTSALTVILIAILAVLVFVYIFSDTFRVVVFGVVAVLGTALFFQRSNAGAASAGPPGPTPVDPEVPPTPTAAPTGPPVPAASLVPTAASDPMPPGSPAPTVPTIGQLPPAPPTIAYPAPVPSPAGFPPPPPGGYRPPFAPHGPYANVPPPPVSPRPGKPPRPPKERSRLGRIVLSLMLLVLGSVAVIDLTVGLHHVTPYFAAPLAVVGIGLVVGAWRGRARWLILLGVVLTFALGVASIADSEQLDEYRRGAEITWHPGSLAELNSSYRVDFADAVLDLRDVDFTTAKEPVTVNVTVGVGRLRIYLPANVDADVSASVDAGDAQVLGRRWGGFDTPTRQVEDNGVDGPGGGRLVLDARIDAGNLEVGR